MATEIKERTRRPKARHSQIIMAAFDERLLMLEQTRDTESTKEHAARLRELSDELRRSLGKDNGDDA